MLCKLHTAHMHTNILAGLLFRLTATIWKKSWCSLLEMCLTLIADTAGAIPGLQCRWMHIGLIMESPRICRSLREMHKRVSLTQSEACNNVSIGSALNTA